MTIGDHKVGASDCVIRFRSFGLWRRRVGALLCAALSSVALTAAEPTDEIKAGREITAIYLGAAPLLEDASAQRYVNLVGRHLADQSSRPALPWTFGILATESVNAFSAPGGFVLLTQGLMDLLETEDELAAILAHEIAWEWRGRGALRPSVRDTGTCRWRYPVP